MCKKYFLQSIAFYKIFPTLHADYSIVQCLGHNVIKRMNRFINFPNVNESFFL